MRFGSSTFSILLIKKDICASLLASLSVMDFINSSRVLAMIETCSSIDVVLVIMTGMIVELTKRGESLSLDIGILSGEENSDSSLYASTSSMMGAFWFVLEV